LMFCGFDIEPFVEGVLARRDGPALCCSLCRSERWNGHERS
jgi:hypothetical protein